MRIVHCMGFLSESAGGPSRSVPALARALARGDSSVTLNAITANDPVSIEQTNGLRVLTHAVSFPRSLAASREHRKAILADTPADIYHGHGVWDLPVHFMAKAARRNHRPYLIAPRGMLEPWALQRSRNRKRLLGWLYAKSDLLRADCLHAISANEVVSFRRYGLKKPIALVPNGVDLEEFADLEQYAGLFCERFPVAAGRPIALFMSRVHPKKGLRPLVKAWARVQPEHPDWILAIAGPDQLGHRAEIEALVSALHTRASVLFTGPLYSEMRLSALAAASIFVLPSFSEGFSMVLLEALASRLPVLTTAACNFADISEHGAGLLCEPTEDSLARGLERLLKANDTELGRMGCLGQTLVATKYTWRRVAQQMMAVYSWLLGSGSRPAWVVGD